MTDFDEGCPGCGYWQCPGNCGGHGYDERYEDEFGNALEDDE